MKRLSLLILVIGLLGAASAYGLVASLGDARMILYANVTAGEVTEFTGTVMVENVNEYPITINIEPDNNYKKIMTMIDNDFVLAPGESKRAGFRVSLQSAGRYDGRLFVSFISADPEIQGKAGQSSRVIIEAKGDVTDHYEEVMGPKETPDDETTPTVTTPEDVKTAPTVTTPTVTTPEDVKTAPNNTALIGIIIIVAIIVIGLVIFFLIKKMMK